MMKGPSFLVVLQLLVFGSLGAHEDTPLKLEKGSLIGLPEKYLPASFDKKKQVLSIAGKTMIFPKVLRGLFTFDANADPLGIEDPRPPKMEAHPFLYSFSSSWYHEGFVTGLPPYIFIQVTPPDDKVRFELLIDMDTMTFVEANAVVEGVDSVPIDLDNIQEVVKPEAGLLKSYRLPLTNEARNAFQQILHHLDCDLDEFFAMSGINVSKEGSCELNPREGLIEFRLEQSPASVAVMLVGDLMLFCADDKITRKEILERYAFAGDPSKSWTRVWQDRDDWNRDVDKDRLNQKLPAPKIGSEGRKKEDSGLEGPSR